MKKYMLLLCLLLPGLAAFGQGRVWERIYSAKGGAPGSGSVIALPNGSWVFAGYDGTHDLAAKAIYLSNYSPTGKAGATHFQPADYAYGNHSVVLGPDNRICGAIPFKSYDIVSYGQVLYRYVPDSGFFQPDSGARRWQTYQRDYDEHDFPYQHYSFSQQPVFSGKRLYLISWGREVYEIDQKSGVKSSFPYKPNYLIDQAFGADDHLFLLGRDTMYRLDSQFNLISKRPVKKMNYLAYMADGRYAALRGETLSIEDTSGHVHRSGALLPNAVFRHLAYKNGRFYLSGTRQDSGAFVACFDTAFQRIWLTPFDSAHQPGYLAPGDSALGVAGNEMYYSASGTDSRPFFNSLSLKGERKLPVHDIRLSDIIVKKFSASKPVYQGYYSFVSGPYSILIKNNGKVPVDTLYLCTSIGEIDWNFYTHPVMTRPIRRRFTGLKLQPGDSMYLSMDSIGGLASLSGNTTTIRFLATGPNDRQDAWPHDNLLSKSFTYTAIQPFDGEEFSIRPSPNPFSSHIRLLGYITSPCTLRLYNLTGRLVLEKTSVRSGEEISLEGLAKGLYQARFESGGKLIHEAKIIKQ